MALVHRQIFVRKMTSKTWSRYNVSIWSENRRRKHDVVTTLDFGRSNNVGKTTLLRRCLTSRPKDNQNPTFSQRRVPAGNQMTGSYMMATLAFNELMKHFKISIFKEFYFLNLRVSCHNYSSDQIIVMIYLLQ